MSESFFSISGWKQRLVFWLGAIFVGFLIVAMTLLSEWAGETYRLLSKRYFWFNFIAAPVGLSLTAWLTFRFFPGSERSGIPQVKTALEIHGDLSQRNHLLSLRIVFGKMLLTIMGLFSGASIGFGGPATHVGASIMASLGRAVRFPAHYMERGLILAGSAAGFAAMFSAPLAGIIFAIEEMGRSLEEKVSSLVLTAIVFSGVTAYVFLDNYIFFTDKSFVLPWGKSWLAIPLCGVAGGVMGGLFSRLLISVGGWLSRSPISIVTIAFACGGGIALLGFYSEGESFGTGYQQAKSILEGEAIDPWFTLYKMGATLLTGFSGVPSGIFVPSIATGASIGANLFHWLPLAPMQVMVLLSITAYFSGMLQSPLTSFVIVMEMTYSHEILIPLMAAAFFATGTSKLIQPVPLYRALCDSYKQYLDEK